jgi:predicted RNase H-like HicB family nuclease
MRLSQALPTTAAVDSDPQVRSPYRGRQVNVFTYPISVFWSDEDEAWVADVPDLPSCSASGNTPHEAVAEVETAIEAWLAAARSSGRTVPAPSVRAAQA